MPDFSSILAQLSATKNNLVNIEDSLEQQRLEVENLMKQLQDQNIVEEKLPQVQH